VVLTGSTGSHGNMILELLIASPAIEKIYYLNRSADTEERQKFSFLEQNSANQDFSKVSFLQSDFGSSYLGLSEDAYNAILLSITVFIDCAWTIDFNVPLNSFEPVHIASTRRAIDFALAAKFRPAIFFISSIASVGNWNTKHGGSLVPETVANLFDNQLPFAQGYAESKHIASQILAIASERSGLKSSVIRAGQLAGPSEEESHSIWNRHEWLPTLVATSKVLGKIPKSLGSQDEVDWVPIDKATGTIVDLVMTAVEYRFQEVNTDKIGKGEVAQNIDIFHLVSPRVVSWGQLYPVVQDFYNQSPTKNAKAIEEIDFKAWLDELRKIPATKSNAEKIPGLKLLDFYSSLDSSTGTAALPSLETVITEQNSTILRHLQPVEASLMRKWLQQ
jgi:thioester reductase-like protein